jgi:hypothetical protein
MAEIPPFYINIILVNKDEVVASAVGNKTGLKTGYLARAAAFAANKLVTDERVVSNLATNLIDKATAAVTELGIHASFKKVFQAGSFVVLRVQILEVDKLTLVLAAKGPDFASSFSSLLTTLSFLGLEATALPTIDHKINDSVYEGMMNKMAEILPKKMQEAGLVVECNVYSAADQANNFYDTLETLGLA